MSTDPLAPVDATAATWLLDRALPSEAAAGCWPRTAPPTTADGATDLCAQVGDLLRASPGYALVDLGLQNEADDLLCNAAWNFFTALCDPVAQYVTGEMFYAVEAAEIHPAHSPFSTSRAEVELHNDGTFLPAAPQIVALLALAAADEGGATVIVDGAAVFAELSAADAAVLLDAHPLDLRQQTHGEPTRSQPIATRDGAGRVRMRYVRRYVEAGYMKAGQEIAAATTAALDHFDALAADEARQIAFRLTRGQLLLVDNERFLHGRRAFKEATSQRRLRRIYGMLR